MTALTRQRDTARSRQIDTDPGENWRKRGACVDHDPELWFGLTAADESAALSICRSCPVIGSCRALADELGKVDGVWAGETAELRRLRRDRARSRRGGTKRVCVECGDEHYGPRYRYCSDTCYLLSRLAESTRQRMRQEIAS